MTNPNCDFEDCMEEDCVDFASNSDISAIITQKGQQQTSKQTSFKIQCSPNTIDMRHSIKETYLTPTKQQATPTEDKLSRMIDNCVKMECGGCRKLIPTHLFYEHLI
jgi:hypothetical protein